MVGRNRVVGVLIGAAVGTLFLVPAHGSAQDSLSVSCAGVNRIAPLEEVISCAEQGSAMAQYFLAVFYTSGRGVPQDEGEAVRWYRRAAEQGHVDAQYLLGAFYAEEDAEEAVRWYRLAAEQGHAEAQVNLGRIYTDGEGVREDGAEAVRWYRLAAEQGDRNGQYRLGLMYHSGGGVPKDLVFAHMWYSLANRGLGIRNPQVTRTTDVIEPLMTPEQIAEAQRLSRGWIEAHPPDGN